MALLTAMTLEQARRHGAAYDLTVVDILPADSLGRFSLAASQTTSRNAYVSLATLQDALDLDGKVNAIFVAGNANWSPRDPTARRCSRTAG